MNLVTDATAALGMPAGTHRLGDFEVMVDAASARLRDGTLAGSILSLDQALRNLVDVTGCALADALPTLTSTPARAIGVDHDRGRIAPGCIADMVLLTPDLRVSATIAEGEVVYAV
jgi:N-acetylglucosamine-6-phosphate deacetylase